MLNKLVALLVTLTMACAAMADDRLYRVAAAVGEGVQIGLSNDLTKAIGRDFTAFQLAGLAHAGMKTFAGPMAAYDFGAPTPSAFSWR